MIDDSKLYNVLLGKIRIKPYWYTNCPLRMRLLAEIFYKKCKAEFEKDGLYTEEQYKEMLVSKQLWLPEDERRLAAAKLRLDDLKVEAYQKYLNEIQYSLVKTSMNKVKTDILELLTRRHKYDYLTIEGMAESHKNRFVVACSLKLKGKRIITSIKQYNLFCSKEIDDVINKVKEYSCSEKDIRYFARSETWRSYWSSKKANVDLFGLPAIKLNDEQRALIVWSSIYDNIMEHPESPPDRVLGDDDLLDGWMIVQRRNREKNKKDNSSFTNNNKIKNAQEVYIPAKSKDDMEKIDAMNDDEARIIKMKRNKQVQDKGEVEEQNFYDVRLELRKQAWESRKRG